MTIVGQGGVRITAFSFTPQFQRRFAKLTPDMQQLVKAALAKLMSQENIRGTIRFEKLKGLRNPDVYTIHVTGNYKISFEIEGTTAILRNVGNHDIIDRKP